MGSARFSSSRLGGLAALFLGSALLGACGAGNASVTLTPPAGTLTAAQIDADPLALLPGSAALLAVIDTHAFYTSGSAGAALAEAAEQLLPIGAEAGFSASRDVDKIALGLYSMQGADVAAVVSGRFDPARIDQAAQSHLQTPGGNVIVASPYAGRTLYTVSNIGFTIITPKTVIAGTAAGMRRALDRLQSGHLQRDLPKWMLDTADTPGSAAAIAADFTSQPPPQLAGYVPWLAGLKTARILADFHPPGLNVAGTLTYADPQAAQSAASGVKQAGSLANVLAITGVVPQLQGLEVNVADTNVQAKFALDDQGLQKVVKQLPQWVGALSGSRH